MKKLSTLIIIVLFLVSGCEFITQESAGPVCGNSVLEEGETSETCCLDAGCGANEFCRNNICIKSPTRCGYCQYPDGDVCRDYVCCTKEDCNDNNPDTSDACVNPQTISAKCTNKEVDECREDSDCDDNDPLTTDTCMLWTPKKCSNIKVTFVDCKGDFDCFINSANQCSRSEINHITTINIFGLEQTTKMYYELKGEDSGSCELYLKTKQIDVKMSDELRQMLLGQGATEEEIAQTEQEANENANLIEGRDGTCKFSSTTNLITLLNKIKDGTVKGGVSCTLTLEGQQCTGTGDWYELPDSCVGSYFSTTL